MMVVQPQGVLAVDGLREVAMKLDVTLGDPIQAGGLALYPLFSGSAGTAQYLSGPAAADAEAFTVSELDEGADVPELQVVNLADLPLLFIEGEMLLGSKQNRTLNLSILCPPRQTTYVPVSCVEAGRWGAPQAAARSAHLASLDVRRAKTESTVRNMRMGRGRVSDQGAVWEEVDLQLARLEIDSPTSALEDAFDAARDRNEEALARLQPAAGQVGVVAVVGGRPTAIDLFDRPETLEAYWDAIVSGYALDGVDAPDAELNRVAVDEFLAKLSGATEQRSPAAGLGEEIHIESEEVTGTGLRWQDELIHLSAYALAGSDGDVLSPVES
jgi:hypothetical protein